MLKVKRKKRTVVRAVSDVMLFTTWTLLWGYIATFIIVGSLRGV